MSERTYGQNCGLARAMDILGERWTVLILRELATGPRRYSELMQRLDGIGSNLLAARLRSLQQAGVIDQEPARDAPHVSAYTLTAAGEELRPTLGQLALWGMRHGREFTESDRTRPSWAILAMFSTAGGRAAARLAGVVEVCVDGERLWAAQIDGTMRVGDGDPPSPPAITISTDLNTLLQLIDGTLTLAQASDRATVTGDPAQVNAFMALYDEELSLSS